jgi:hypothetical protein
MSNAYVDEKGFPRAPCEQVMFQIPTRPKTLQRKSKQSESIQKYRNHLRKQLQQNKDALDLLIDKEMLLYIIAYLNEKNYYSYDVDNIPWHFCDVLKEFTSSDKKGDNKIISLIVEKRMIKNKPPEAFTIDECEEFLVFITHEMYKKFIFD